MTSLPKACGCGRSCTASGWPLNLPPGALYYVGCIDEPAAASLLDTDIPDLVPQWRQFPDGRVELDFCGACARALDCWELLTGKIAGA